MDFAKVPIGFGMALARNEVALNAYAAMTESQKRQLLEKASNVDSEAEMHRLVSGIAKREG